MPGVFVGLDYGRRRIGIAVSSGLGTVHPRPRLERRTPAEDFRVLAHLAGDVEAEGLVLGLPHNMDGSPSAMEAEVREFAAGLAAATGLPVYGTDERLTSEAAESILAARDLDGRTRKARRDSAAACIILQDFLGAGETRVRLA